MSSPEIKGNEQQDRIGQVFQSESGTDYLIIGEGDKGYEVVDLTDSTVPDKGLFLVREADGAFITNEFKKNKPLTYERYTKKYIQTNNIEHPQSRTS